ncbi:MAG TPA: hypothetical protein VFZ61_16705, partial [Polyangiales bacterium]
MAELDAKRLEGRARAFRILYVDDSYAQLDSMRQSLSSSGYQLSTASSQREGIERMQRDSPD